MIPARLATASIALGLAFGLAGPLRADPQTEALISACSDGDMLMCQQLGTVARDPTTTLTPLERLAEAFAQRAVGLTLTGADGEPDLERTYAIVVEDYFAAPAMKPDARARYFRVQALGDCAEHYNDTWKIERHWWPTDASGAVDWRTLYLHMLDHYFGHCIAEAGT